jgi:hypothetical protein
MDRKEEVAFSQRGKSWLIGKGQAVSPGIMIETKLLI